MKPFIAAGVLIILNSATAFGQFAEFSFTSRIHKFEPAPAGTWLECVFPFSNSGEIPLIITSYHVECTCTQVEFPAEPVLPGAQGTIRVRFDSTGKIGWQYRKILLDTNTRKKTEELEIRVKITG